MEPKKDAVNPLFGVSEALYESVDSVGRVAYVA